MTRSSFFTLAVIGVTLACRPDGTADGFTVRDSAGVHVVVSASATWSESDVWSVDSVPLVMIGVQDGDEDYQFYRIGGALRQPDGTIVVSNAGSGELRFYEQTGKHLRSAGRHGAGPGEFGEFSSMTLWERGDGDLVVWDSHNRRVNLFRPDGQFIRSEELNPLPEAPRGFLLGVFRDDTWLVWGPVGGGRLSGAPGTTIESQFVYWRTDPTGEPLNEFAQVRGRPRYVHQFAGITRYPYIPLSAEPLATAGHDAMLLLENGGPPLRRFALNGTLQSVIRWAGPPPTPVSDAWDEYQRVELASMQDPNDERWYRHFLAQDLPLPHAVPRYDGLRADRGGNVWLRRERHPGIVAQLWDVLDPNGRWLGTVRLPPGARPLDIGQHYVLSRHVDELGVERIHLYQLAKP